jgi:hypothetical protein
MKEIRDGGVASIQIRGQRRTAHFHFMSCLKSSRKRSATDALPRLRYNAQFGAGQFGSPTSTKLAQKKGWAAPLFARRSWIISNSASCSAAALLLPDFNDP